MRQGKLILIAATSLILGAATATLVLITWPRAPGPDGEAINNGFFFYRGTYVSPPYFLRLDEDGLKLNGICIWRAFRSPRGRPIAKEDPGPFKWTPELIAAGTSAPGFLDHAADRFWYWFTTVGFDEACRRYESYMREQPVIVTVERSRAGDYRVTGTDGEKRWIGFSRPVPGADVEHIKRDRESLMAQHEMAARLLRGGGALLVLNGHVTVPGSKVLTWLPALYDMLTSDKSTETKLAYVKAEFYADPEEAHVFLTGFDDSPMLKKRIEALKRVYAALTNGTPRGGTK